MSESEGMEGRWRCLWSIILVFGWFLFGIAAAAAPPVDPALVKQTAQGSVIGMEHKATNTISWKGIPFAKPPVGDLRWKAPQDPDVRAEPFEAFDFCQICPQYIDHDENRTTPQIIMGDEDCLYLNIWRPKSRDNNLPVFFWIHGGGNSVQWPMLSWTDASMLANRANMVVVTASYRLGPMGWFSHPSLRTGREVDRAQDSGNFGTLDQIHALTWVRDNIKSFGGDPAKVTIAGESAGGQNVLMLVGSPLAKGLFRQAIVQSGVVRPRTLSQGEEHANIIIAKLMIKDGSASDEAAAAGKLKKMSIEEVARYLRSKSAREFLETYAEGPTRGMIHFPNWFSDGTVMPVEFYKALKAGDYNKVPIILGSNKEETKLFMLGSSTFAPWLADGSLFREPAKGALYSQVTAYQSGEWKARAVDKPARLMRAHDDQPGVWAYEFHWGAGGMQNSVIPRPYGLILGACHAMEIDFIFGTEAVSLGRFAFDRKNRPGRVKLSNTMMDYWAQFTWNGDPNPKDSELPRWKSWSNEAGGPKAVIFDADVADLKITMSDRELTMESLGRALQEEPNNAELKPLIDSFSVR